MDGNSEVSRSGFRAWQTPPTSSVAGPGGADGPLDSLAAGPSPAMLLPWMPATCNRTRRWCSSLTTSPLVHLLLRRRFWKSETMPTNCAPMKPCTPCCYACARLPRRFPFIAEEIYRNLRTTGMPELSTSATSSPAASPAMKAENQMTQEGSCLPVACRFHQGTPTTAALHVVCRDEVISTWSALGDYRRDICF